MYIYNEDYAMIETNYLPYKGIEYHKDSIKVMIKNDVYSILDIEQNKYTFRLMLLSENNECKTIEIEKNKINAYISRIIPLDLTTNKEEVVYDNPNSMSLMSGIIWYVIVMVGGLIFKDWLTIWAVASFIFWPWFLNKPRFKQ